MRNRRAARALRARSSRKSARAGCLRAAVWCCLLAVLATPTAATAQALPGSPLRSTDSRAPVLLTADELVYDDAHNTVTARGRVELVQGDRVVRADALSYDRAGDIVTATGNVVIVEASGDVVFADRAQLDQNFRNGMVENLRLLLQDGSRFAAASGRRAEGRVTVLRDVIYSPCDICRDDPSREPLWQLRSRRVTRDEAEQRVYHRDAWIEFFGVPVLYAPFLAHPDGVAQRQSGFLLPEARTSSKLGLRLTTPYFQTLGPSADVTIYPTVLTRELPVIGAEYRQRLERGQIRISGSITDSRRQDDAGNIVPGRQLRFHGRAQGQFDIDDEWRWGFDGARTSDRFYLSRYSSFRRYGFEDQQALTSRIYAERIADRSYFGANAYSFQDLRPNFSPVRRPEIDDSLTPVVGPFIEYRWSSEPLLYGSRFTVDANALSIYRRLGSRTQRAAFSGGWFLPLVLDNGQLVRLDARVVGEFYNASNIGNAVEAFRPSEDGARGRLFPQVAVTWSWPFVNRGTEYNVTIEPMAQIVAAPVLRDQGRFPNEDSRGLDFDESTLFRLNRYTGYDRLEGGQRATYGLRFAVTRARGGQVTGFIGQSYRFNRATDFPAGSGLDSRSSDVVGRLTVLPHPWLTASYQFQHDGASLRPRRNLVSVTVGPPQIRLSASIVYFNRDTLPDPRTDLTQPDDRRSVAQFDGQLNVRLNENWRLQARHIRFLGPVPANSARSLITGVAAIYEDECFVFGIDVARRNSTNPNLPSDTAVVVRLGLRNLGDLGVGS
jgi:LPS-assembly protein